ncbi:hypothetical protein ACF07D_15910 [Leucobacter sp. NPDC015123]|uniref:hypothetical protein n=1 Tax=Leucobacter sp. NPDC015123 TaxID=3364129 RepID=UPI0036F47EE9
MSESDGIEEAMDGQLRILVTAASQVGQMLARLREEALRRAEARSIQEHRELQSRLDAERAAARAELGNVHQRDWWDRATPEQIGHSYQVARAWAGEDQEAARAELRMRDELQSRYAIDVNNTGADPSSVQQMVRLQMERAERDLANAATERNRAAAEEAEAARLMADANQAEQAAENARAIADRPGNDSEAFLTEAERSERDAMRYREDSQNTYDSSQRRDATAASLERQGINEQAIGARMRSDVSNAKPATEAARNGAAKKSSAKARPSRGRGAQMQRSGLER